MKKLVAALVVLAMIVAMVPTVFAVTESGNFMLQGGQSYDWTAEYTGTANLYSENVSNIMVDGGNTAMGFYPSFDVTAGTTYSIQHFGEGFDVIYWEIEVAGGNNDGPELEANQLAIESYSFTTWTAPQDGNVKFTINVSGASLSIYEGWTRVGVGTDSVTVAVTAGTTYDVCPDQVSVDSIVTWEYVTGEGGNEPTYVPVGGELAQGDNNVQLSYATMPAQAPSWVFVPSENGSLTVTVVSVNGNTNLGMAFGRGAYTLLAGNANGMMTNTVTIDVVAFERVNIAVLDSADFDPVPAVINISLETNAGGGQDQEDLNAQYQGSGTEADPYIVDEIPVNLGVTLTPVANDLYFQYTATEAGVISFGETDATVWPIVNGSWNYSSDPIEVAAGDVVIFNIFGVYTNVYVPIEFEAGATLGGGQGGGQGGELGETIPVESGTEEIDDTESVEFYFTPDADGVLTVSISADPGFKFWVFDATTDASLTLPESDVTGTYTYNLEADVQYRILIIGYHDWAEAAATITYDASFQSATIEAEQVELDISDADLVVGEQNVELLPNAITTLFNFAAPEAGIYTVTIPNDAIAELYSIAWTSYQICEGNTLVFTATDAEQGFLIGLTSESDSMTVKIEKTGTYTPPAPTTYLNYEATVDFDDEFEMPEGELISVDITAAQTVVEDANGYYHLGTVNGPILYVNLNSDGFTLATLMNAGAPITMRGDKFTGEDGELYCYDYMNMIAYGDYYSYSLDCDYYPLNADLMAFFQDYGAAQGWYTAGLSNFEVLNEGEFNEESAWMVALVYIEAEEEEGETPEGGNTEQKPEEKPEQKPEEKPEQKPEAKPEEKPEGGNAQTSDFGIIGAAIAMTVSAIGGVAVVAKKKEF